MVKLDGSEGSEVEKGATGMCESIAEPHAHVDHRCVSFIKRYACNDAEERYRKVGQKIIK